MIAHQVKIHDKYSLEFKISFVTDNKVEDINEFKINTWIFVPNSIDINSGTYNKEQFYKDVKNNIRLITPIYSLNQILENGRGPIPRLQKAIESLLQNGESEELTEHYAYQVKMFSCVVKSALREEVYRIEKEKDADNIINLVEQYAANIRSIASKYRELYTSLEHPSITAKQHDYFLFSDEFLGNTIEQHTFQLITILKKKCLFESLREELNKLISDENRHKQSKGFQIVEEENTDTNKRLILKRNILKKFVESDLYLQTHKKKDGAFAEQFYYSIAAGVAMIFATVIAFFATQRYGNFTTDLFFVLVISYMLKDRIKELMRYYFSSHLSRKYFDNKRRLAIRKQEIGWMKDAFDFIPDSKVPQEVLNLRNRTPLVEAENEIYDEKIILYRKLVHLSKEDIEKFKEYKLVGINDITRFNLISFIQKMDNPTIPLYIPDEEKGYREILGHKEYPLFFVLVCESEKETYYKKYRLMFNRYGISGVSELD